MIPLVEWFLGIFDLFFQVDVYLFEIVRSFGAWSYAIITSIVFVETGLVLAPFLPGDSLIFASGAFAGKGVFRLPLLFWLFTGAAVLGDTVNYLIGRWCRRWLAEDRHIRWINRQHLRDAQEFYAKHGSKMVVIARFVPVIRTFAPFVAGLGVMPYRVFLAYNVIGGVLWVGSFLWAGYAFGNIPFVSQRFSLVVAGVACISMIPLVMEYVAHKRQQRADKRAKA